MSCPHVSDIFSPAARGAWRTAYKNPTVAKGLVPFDVQRGVIRCTKISPRLHRRFLTGIGVFLWVERWWFGLLTMRMAIFEVFMGVLELAHQKPEYG